MKHYLIFSFYLLGLISCSSEYEQEDEMYECLETEYSEAGIDLNNCLDSLAYYLIQDSLLTSSTGEAFEEFLTDLSQPNYTLKIKKNTEDYFHYVFIAIRPPSMCRNKFKLDSNISSGTTLDELFYYESISWRLWVDQSNHFQTINEILSAADLKHPIYQQYVLREFANEFIFWNLTSCSGPALLYMCDYDTREGPPDSIQFSDSIKIFMDTDYHITIDGEQVSLENVSEHISAELAHHISAMELPVDTLALNEPNEGQLLIKINSSENTAYNSKCNLFEEIRKAYLIKHDWLALKYYNKPFDSLSRNQEYWIHTILPVHVFPK
ncbi:MAG: hypothetical protein GQ574_19995 [Crocinitomix sp.]|nr:hypothetical protein [Crocinitomix sp.]